MFVCFVEAGWVGAIFSHNLKCKTAHLCRIPDSVTAHLTWTQSCVPLWQHITNNHRSLFKVTWCANLCVYRMFLLLGLQKFCWSSVMQQSAESYCFNYHWRLCRAHCSSWQWLIKDPMVVLICRHTDKCVIPWGTTGQHTIWQTWVI